MFTYKVIKLFVAISANFGLQQRDDELTRREAVGEKR
jgi:hypothetical protein